jgi:hypothetical protein
VHTGSVRLFFSSPLTGPRKNVPRTEYILVWSPGARVGQARMNVDEMNRSRIFDLLWSGIVIGIWGSTVAVDKKWGGSREVCLILGVTTFVDRAFWTSVDM